MRALQFTEFGPVSNLRLIELPDPEADQTTAVVKVAASAISPSDVKNVEGKMEHVTLPRVPGRDYAGTVFRGPAEWVGVEGWGTGGGVGLTGGGRPARRLAVPVRGPPPQPPKLTPQPGAAGGRAHFSPRLRGLG